VIFAHDTEVALAAAAALVNTETEGGMDSLADLDAFLAHWGFTGSRTHDEVELAAVQALRPRLREIWQVDKDEAVRIVNALLREGSALPYLMKHDEWDYHVHATAPEQPLADRMMVEAAMAFVDVIRTDELARLSVCAAHDCSCVLVDLSKNRSRRFCDHGCGNRANVAAYRARKRASS
jgi:predicted RNA-binding Zn ribbon-like protein